MKKNVFTNDEGITNIVETLKQNIIHDLEEVSKKIMNFNTNDPVRFSVIEDGGLRKNSSKSHTPSFRKQLIDQGK